MAAWPTYDGQKRLSKTVVPGSVTVQTSVAGKEVRIGYQSTPRYRYVLKYEVLRSTDPATLIAFIASVHGNRDTFTFTDPESGSTMTCRLDMSEIELQRIVQGLWSSAEIEMVTVL